MTFYELAKNFKLPGPVIQATRDYVERCFTSLFETTNFLELSYPSVSKILNSSGLDITSEIEVIDAAKLWLGHLTKYRTKFAHNLLLKARLPLLSNHALLHLIDKLTSFFSVNHECVETLREVLNSRDNFIRNNPDVSLVHRNCSHTKFSILVCGGKTDRRTVNTVNKLHVSNFNNLAALPEMRKKRCHSEAVCLKGEVYLIGGNVSRGKKYKTSVEKYPLFGKKRTWKKVPSIPSKRQYFCACAFMNKIIVLGGSLYLRRVSVVTSSCVQFDTKKCKWKKVADMSQPRINAACTLFEGNIVVAGGRSILNNVATPTVELYDAIADVWSPMASMTSEKFCHSVVVNKGKLIIIGSGGQCSEIFDNTAKLFVAIKESTISSNLVISPKAISDGSKIIILQDGVSCITWYDVDNNEWSIEDCNATKDLAFFSCVKVPLI